MTLNWNERQSNQRDDFALPPTVFCNCRESPVSTLNGLKVLSSDPFTAFVQVLSAAPSPERFPDLAIHIAKHLLANPMLVVVAPAAQNRVEIINDCCCFHLRVGSEPVPDGL